MQNKPKRVRIVVAEQMDPAFIRALRNTGFTPTPALYKLCLQWLKMHENDFAFTRYDAFFLNFSKSLEQARELIENWRPAVMNGKKGQEYRQEFTLPQDLYVIRFKMDAPGLTLEKTPNNSYVLHGIPQEAGDFTITFSLSWPELNRLYRKDQSIAANHLQTKEIKFSILPDPKDLWRNIPTPENLEYYKPDEDALLIECEDYYLLGASVRGRSHAHTGLPRDDDFDLSCGAWKILMVADGAGSAKFSRQGSRLACETAISVCKEYLPSDKDLMAALYLKEHGSDPNDWIRQMKTLAYNPLARAAYSAKNRIQEEAKARERLPKDYATTLLICICKKIETVWVVMSFQIGDGAMALFADGRVELLAEPDEGEFGGQTRFITMKELFATTEDLASRINIHVVRDLETLILMTDGVSDAKFATLNNLRNPEKWLELRADLKSCLKDGEDMAQSLKDWLQFWSQGNHDDRTIAIMDRL